MNKTIALICLIAGLSGLLIFAVLGISHIHRIASQTQSVDNPAALTGTNGFCDGHTWNGLDNMQIEKLLKQIKGSLIKMTIESSALSGRRLLLPGSPWKAIIFI